MRREFFGSAGTLPCETTRYSLLTTRCRLTIRYSPLATRRRFGSAGASSSHFFPVPRPMPLVPLKVGAQ